MVLFNRALHATNCNVDTRANIVPVYTDCHWLSLYCTVCIAHWVFFSLVNREPITALILCYSNRHTASQPVGLTDPIMEVAPRPKNELPSLKESRAKTSVKFWYWIWSMSTYCNLQYVICNMQFATCNLQHAICNMQFVTCNLQQVISNVQFSTSNLQHAICNV